MSLTVKNTKVGGIRLSLFALDAELPRWSMARAQNETVPQVAGSIALGVFVHSLLHSHTRRVNDIETLCSVVLPRRAPTPYCERREQIDDSQLNT
jgi:hypothetical protein